MLLAPVFVSAALPLVLDPIALVFGFVVVLVTLRVMLADLL
jgi:hypothetical protein